MSAMNRYFTPDPHHDRLRDADLQMWDMVRALRIDLAGAIRHADLPVEKLGTMLRKCHGCAFAQMCTLFLERRQGRADQAPSYCPNRAQLAALRPVPPAPPTGSAAPQAPQPA